MTNLSPFINFYKTPPLWKATSFEITQFIFPEIRMEQFTPQPIPSNIRLGRQLEHVFYQLLSWTENYEVLVYNLPVKNESRTLGEIDFILKNHQSKELLHVELTYKFYLVDTSISEPIHQLIGPNRKDTFFRKIEKIKNQQFPLIYSAEANKILKEREIDHTHIISQACFKAQLFLPYQLKGNNYWHLNSDCIVGFWIREQEFVTTKFNDYQYYMPFKSEWVLVPNDTITWKSHQEIIPEVILKMKNKMAPMIWIKKSKIDFEKCFVVWW